MNITDLVNEELGKSEDKIGKENELISLLRQSLTLIKNEV